MKAEQEEVLLTLFAACKSAAFLISIAVSECGVKSKWRGNLFKPSRALHLFSEIRKKPGRGIRRMDFFFIGNKEERSY